jgi:hypothetical protein
MDIPWLQFGSQTVAITGKTEEGTKTVFSKVPVVAIPSCLPGTGVSVESRSIIVLSSLKESESGHRDKNNCSSRSVRKNFLSADIDILKILIINKAARLTRLDKFGDRSSKPFGTNN